MASSVLLLYNYSEERVSNAIRHNVEAFERYSSHRIYPLDTVRDGLESVELSQFDVILIHWSVVIARTFRDAYIGRANFERLVDFTGAKFIFVQDEYRWIDQTIEAVHELRAKALFSVLCPGDMAKVYADPRLAGTELVGVLTGYLEPEVTHRKVRLFREREIDVGYRARDLSGQHAWLGELAQEKVLIAQRFRHDTADSGLRLDISTRWEDRLFGDDWLRFVCRCKAQLGTESGASLCDRDDTIRRRVHAYVETRPEAAFEEIRDACFPGLDWKTPARGLSPRCLEAAALRTLMINYEGDYHGLLEPWVHYVPLKKDHSNLPEVISILKHDTPRAEAIIARAYDDFGCNPAYQYSGFIDIVDRKITQYAHIRPSTAATLSRGQFEQMKADCKREARLRELHRQIEELHQKTEELQSLHLNLGSLQHQHGEAIYWLVSETGRMVSGIGSISESITRAMSRIEQSRRDIADLRKSIRGERSATKRLEHSLHKIRRRQQRIAACLTLVLLLSIVAVGGWIWALYRGWAEL